MYVCLNVCMYIFLYIHIICHSCKTNLPLQYLAPTRLQETWGVDIVGITSAMSALTTARRWRESAFLFQGLHRRSLEATGMSYTVATGQKESHGLAWVNQV